MNLLSFVYFESCWNSTQWKIVNEFLLLTVYLFHYVIIIKPRKWIIVELQPLSTVTVDLLVVLMFSSKVPEDNNCDQMIMMCTVAVMIE